MMRNRKIRMLKFRDLINPNILNDEDMVGFQGDSEYVNGEGELVMGTWTFVCTMEDAEIHENEWTLDSEFPESVLWDELTYYDLLNDNGTLCEIRLVYNKR